MMEMRSMKKYISIFEMGTGRKLYWIVGGATVMAALELALFYALGLGKESGFSEEVKGSFLIFVFLFFSTFGTMYAVSTYKKNKKAIYRYLLMDVKRSTAFLITILAGTLVYIFYWAVQAVLLYVLLLIYQGEYGDMTGIEIYTQFHENSLLMSTLPLGSFAGWLGVVLRAMLLGVSGAIAEHFVRNGSFAIGICIAAIQITNPDYVGTYALNVDLLILPALFTIFLVNWVILKGKPDDIVEGGESNED